MSIYSSVLSLLLQPSAKLDQILDIWSSGRGVVSLHVFQNTTSQEAFTREAAMIDAIGERQSLVPDLNFHIHHLMVMSITMHHLLKAILYHSKVSMYYF